MMCPENLPPAGPGRAHAECYTSLRPTPGPSPPTGEAPRQSNARSDSGSPSRSDPRSDLEYSVEVAVGKSRSLGVVVYGDGDMPDTGEWLAKELSGHGIKHVVFVNGGAPELRSLEQPGAGR